MVLLRIAFLSFLSCLLIEDRANAAVYDFRFTPGDVLDYGIDCGSDCLVTRVTDSPPPRGIVFQFDAELLPRLTLRNMTLSMVGLPLHLPSYLRLYVNGNAVVIDASFTFDHRSRLIDFYIYGANIDGEWEFAPGYSSRSGEACVLYLDSGYEDCNQTYITSGPTVVTYPALIPVPSSLSLISLGILTLFFMSKRARNTKFRSHGDQAT
jgi:hypothetical protein